MNDDSMLGPGVHENNAQNAIASDDAATAQVFALLAIAAAVNRLADAQETLAKARR
ncbi:hypothetical protein [Amycolatopsis japonica]